jgi:hypothetical protein
MPLASASIDARRLFIVKFVGHLCSVCFPLQLTANNSFEQNMCAKPQNYA